MSSTLEPDADVILLDAAGLAASRPGRPLFADVSVTIADGDRVGVVGLNGSGKSTLLRQLAGRVEPEAGVVRRGRGARVVMLDQDAPLVGATIGDVIGTDWDAAAILDRLGVRPDVIVGHSTGEVAAAYLAGVYSLADAVRVIRTRSHLQQRLSGRGRMAAVGVSVDIALEVIERVGGGIDVAAVNGPAAVTLAGRAEALEELGRSLGDGVFYRLLTVEVPFHSATVDQNPPTTTPLQPAMR